MIETTDERKTIQIDGHFVDGHLEETAAHFKYATFDSNDGAFTNLEFFVREYHPELANNDAISFTAFYATERTVMHWAQRFGHISIYSVGDINDPFTGCATDEEIADDCRYVAQLGTGTPVFATTRKGAIVLAVIQSFREYFHEQQSGGGGIRIVK